MSEKLPTSGYTEVAEEQELLEAGGLDPEAIHYDAIEVDEDAVDDNAEQGLVAYLKGNLSEWAQNKRDIYVHNREAVFGNEEGYDETAEANEASSGLSGRIKDATRKTYNHLKVLANTITGNKLEVDEGMENSRRNELIKKSCKVALGVGVVALKVIIAHRTGTTTVESALKNTATGYLEGKARALTDTKGFDTDSLALITSASALYIGSMLSRFTKGKASEGVIEKGIKYLSEFNAGSDMATDALSGMATKFSKTKKRI